MVDEQGARAWTVVGRQRLVDSRWLRVDQEDVRLPNGAAIDGYYVVHEPDFAMTFAVTEAGQVLLVRQYKHGIGRVMLELPAGYLETGDLSAEEAVRRELREETGYEPAQVRPLGRLVCSPTRASSYGHYFLATGCRQVAGQSLDPTEQIDLVLVDLADLRLLVRASAIEVQSSIAGIFLALDALQDEC